MVYTPFSIYLIGSDAVSNIQSCAVLNQQFPNADVRFFVDPALMLNRIQESPTPMHRTLICLDLQTRGMSWITFLEFFSDLSPSVQERYCVFLSSAADKTLATGLLAPFQFVTNISKPITTAEIPLLEQTIISTVQNTSTDSFELAAFL